MSIASPGWQSLAACAGNPGPFFGPDRETAQDRRRRAREARVVCFGCPVRLDCLAFAHATGLHHGVWGGVDFDRDPRQLRPLCGKGLHVMDADNTSVDPDGHRNCRACRRDKDRRLREKRRERRRQEREVAA